VRVGGPPGSARGAGADQLLKADENERGAGPASPGEDESWHGV
jgi:hypothetical protein